MKLLQKASNSGYIGHSILIFLIRFFPSLANILIVIAFSRLLEKEVYGVYQGFWVNVFLLSILASLGIQSFVVTYSQSKVASLIKRLRFRSIILLSSWVVGLGFLFAVLQKSAANLSMITACAFLVVYTAGIILESVLTVFKRFKMLLGASFLYTVLFIVLHWMYLHQHISLTLLFQYILLLGVLKLLPFILIAIKDIKAEPDDTIADIKEVRKLWLHVGFFEVSQRALVWIDKFILGLFLGSELFAVYYNGSIQIPFLPLLLGAVGSAMLMQLADPKESGVSDKVALVKHSGSVLAAVVFPLFYFFLIYRYELFSQVFANRYNEAVPIFFVTMLVLPLRAYNFTTILQHQHKGGIINTGVLLDLLIIIVSIYPLYLWLDLPGVALSFVIGSYVQGGFYLYKTGAVIDVSVFQLIPYKGWLLKLLLFGSVTIGFHYITVELFPEQIVLILGLLFTSLLCIAALYRELKQPQVNG